MPAAAQRRASSPGVSSAERVQPFTVTVPSTSVDRHRDAIAEPSRGREQELVLERGGADEHALCTGLERVSDRVEAAVAAADLYRRTDRGDARDEIEVGSTRERAVEVDEVEPGGALRCEALSRGDRIATLDGHCLPAALREANDAALENVDRRVDREVFAR